MNTTTTKRGARSKSLALVASLTMMGAGLVGVAVAAPASAVDATGYDATAYPGLNVCPQNTDGWSSHQGADDKETWTFKAPTDTLITEICVKAGSDNQGDGPVKVLFVGPADEVTFGYPGGKEISHFSYRTTPKPTTSLKVDKAWVGAEGAETASAELAAKLGSGDAGPLTVTVGGAATGQAWGVAKTGLTIGAKALVSEGTVPALDPADFPTGYRCSLVTDGYPLISPNDFALASTPNSVTVTNAVTCTEIPPGTTSLTVNKEWVGTNGTASETLADALGNSDAGDLSVTVDGDATGQAWGATEFDLAIGDEVVVSEGPVPALDPADFPADYTCSLVTQGYPTYSDNDFDLVAGGNTVTVTNAVSCTLIPDEPPVEPPTTTSTPEPPVVETAVVEAPAPVAAALPATVEAAAPAPATVNVPAAATVPAAVPAGDGSQAPGLPMWALALVVVGAIGAAAAGKQMLGARN